MPPLVQVACVESTAPKPVCKVSPHSGCIPPGEHITLDIAYAPASTGTHTVDTFELSTPGGNRVGSCPFAPLLLPDGRA